MRADNIFIYHLDYELQDLFNLRKAHSYNIVYESFDMITRIAFLLCNESILIPASNYFESDIAFSILNKLSSFYVDQLGIIKLISSSYNLNELLQKKVKQHGDSLYTIGYHYADFLKEDKKIYLPGSMKKREASASEDIHNAWLSAEGIEGLAKLVYEITSGKYKASVLEDKIGNIPEKLGEQAYISRYIVPLLELDINYKETINTVINLFITREYIKSFLSEYDAICLKDIPLIDSELVLPKEDGYNHISYSEYIMKLRDLDYSGTNALTYVKKCNADELLNFKFDQQWKNVIENEPGYGIILPIAVKAEVFKLDTKEIKIGIITALAKECAAVKKMLDNVQELFFEGRGAGHRFFVGEIKSANGGIHKVALGQCGMGNNKASIRAMSMRNHFPELESILMVGIAGGIPTPNNIEKHVRLGDIVVSQGIVQYDFIKETSESIICRSEPPKPSAKLMEAINILQVKEYEDIYKWKEYVENYTVKQFSKPAAEDILHDINGEIIDHPLDDSRDGYPKVFYGKIASANTLLKSFEKRQYLKEQFDVFAVEMEASGIADATWDMDIGYLVIRGICDYCDKFKNDDWQNYAAMVAANYAKDLIENLPSFN